ncbi:MAG TPA: glycosyltransferase [Bdellovibrionales bacterium]|nr:glycosyltransferase [Bdellovibrionales bacterium]
MGKIVFFDNSSKAAYSPESFRSRAYGGTVGSILRAAEGLAARGHSVWVAQKHRGHEESFGARYVPLAAPIENPGAVVVIRNARTLRDAHLRFPRSRLYLWLHTIEKDEEWLAQHYDEIRHIPATLVCLSRFHHGYVREKLAARGIELPMAVVPNSVDDHLGPNGPPFDPNKLIYFSASDRALARALVLFEKIHWAQPDMRLFIARPGYGGVEGSIAREGVIDLGPQPQENVLEHARGALCTFYPNTSVPEAFGLVFAESNAVGTPVLTGDVGAAREVLAETNPPLDVHNGNLVLETVLKWRAGERPAVSVRPEFRLKNVLPVWESLLHSD